ncbi:hypothetical protein BKA70DRAFT_1566266 [Coprinopsis sp. MPI-PUGE-AT-0042]|nr:hypothetical protein BKA70DRAFT_1566266 [Coprinopsis sp. MPI-PUGE-AT-0042]
MGLGLAKPQAGPKALPGPTVGPGLAWPEWARLGPALGLRPKPVHHYVQLLGLTCPNSLRACCGAPEGQVPIAKRLATADYHGKTPTAWEEALVEDHMADLSSDSDSDGGADRVAQGRRRESRGQRKRRRVQDDLFTSGVPYKTRQAH